MKSLRAKILLALVASVVVALLVSSALSRLALHRGFVQFLEQQEEHQLELLQPELAALYRRSGGWEALAHDPRRWMRWLALQRPEGVRPPEGGRPEDRGRPPRDPARHLWRRLFVLDANREWVAGARSGDPAEARMVPVEVSGATVGWVGFRPTGRVVAPEGQRFLELQRRSLAVALVLALGVAGGLGVWLARNLARPVGRVGETVAALTAGDFSARTGLERRDELGQLARHVDRLAETLEANRTARRRWTADVAHELRTPVAILRGELAAVNDGVRPLSNETLASLGEEVRHLGRLVDDLQTLALADAGALDVRYERFDAADLTRHVLESFGDRLADSGLSLDAHLPERLALHADPQRIRQLLQNLLENACRYTAAGGTVRLVLKAVGGEAEWTIEDSAPGVPGDQRARLFERFYRGEGSRGRSGGGSGLGLAICREIIAAHGGRIEADDSPLGGLRILTRLPLDV